MGSRSGLKKVIKTARGKHGVVKRSYWVRAKDTVGAFATRHKRKIIGGVVTAATVGALAYGHRHAIRGAVGTANLKRKEMDHSTPFGAKLRAIRGAAKDGWNTSTKRSGTWSSDAAKLHHKHWGTAAAKKRTTKVIRTHAHNALKSEMTADLAQHFGTAAGAYVGHKMSKNALAARKVGAVAVGGIVGEHLAKMAVRAAVRRVRPGSKRK